MVDKGVTAMTLGKARVGERTGSDVRCHQAWNQPSAGATIPPPNAPQSVEHPLTISLLGQPNLPPLTRKVRFARTLVALQLGLSFGALANYDTPLSRASPAVDGRLARKPLLAEPVDSPVTAKAENPIYNATLNPERLNGVNLEAIRGMNGVDSERITSVVAYMITKHNLTPKGAAYLTGNFLWESNLNPNVKPGDSESAYGLGQWRFERSQGMPEDLFGQIDFAIDIEMDRDGEAAYLNELLRDPNASVDAITIGIQKWERYGVEGPRFEFGAIILAQMQSPVAA